MRTIGLALGVSVVLGVGACSVDINGDRGREAGPLDDEVGKVTYWRVSSSSSTIESCTDAAMWSDAVKAPDFKDNSFLMYKVLEGKKSALMQSCETTSASTCVDDEDMTLWTINGNTLSYVSEAVTISGDEQCDYLLRPSWTLIDQGEKAQWIVDMYLKRTPTRATAMPLTRPSKRHRAMGAASSAAAYAWTWSCSSRRARRLRSRTVRRVRFLFAGRAFLAWSGDLFG